MQEAELHALVDGQLSPERRAEIEDYLLHNKEDAALVECWRRQNAALRAAFEPVARETPPLSLRNAAARNAANGAPPIETGVIHWGRPSSSFRPPRRLDEAREGRRRRALLVAAATVSIVAAIACLSLLFSTRLRTSPQEALRSPILSQGYVDRAAISYATFARETHPIEFDAARKVEFSQILSARVGFALAPDLASLGLTLLGGRVVPGLMRPAGVLIYENSEAVRVALYFERANAGPASFAPPRLDQELTAIEWRGAGMAFVLIGPLAPEEMQRSAERAAFDILSPARGEGAP